MLAGTISKLYQDGEFGKIITKNGEEAHFHKGCLWNVRFDVLTEGQGVEFEMQASHKGYLAFHVRLQDEDNFLITEENEDIREAKRILH